MTLPSLLTDLPWYALAAVPLVVLAGYTVFGATGFGSSIVSVPLLAHIFPLTFTVPLITAVDALAATTTSLRLKQFVAWPEIMRLLPPMLIGITLGATIIVNLPRAPALIALGVFAAAYGSYLLAGARKLRRAPSWLAWPIGLAGGVFSALFGTGGPVYMVYLSARVHDKAALRATSAVVVTVSVWIRVVAFAIAGLLLDPALLLLGAALLPVMVVGLRLGNRLHHALSRQGVLRAIAVLLIVNGVSLIARATLGS